MKYRLPEYHPHDVWFEVPENIGDLDAYSVAIRLAASGSIFPCDVEIRTNSGVYCYAVDMEPRYYAKLKGSKRLSIKEV